MGAVFAPTRFSLVPSETWLQTEILRVVFTRERPADYRFVIFIFLHVWGISSGSIFVVGGGGVVLFRRFAVHTEFKVCFPSRFQFLCLGRFKVVLNLALKIAKEGWPSNPKPHHSSLSAPLVLDSQVRKRSTNSNFCWVGVFHANGWGPKSSVCPSKPRETKLWAGYPGSFAGISQGCPMRKKVLCSIIGP